MTGEVQEHQPNAAQNPEHREVSGRFSAAEQLLRALNEGKDPTSEITELIDDSGERGTTEDRIVADEVGELAIVDHVSEGSEVPRLLGEQPLDELEIALKDLAEARGAGAAETVIDAIERVEQEHGLTGEVEVIDSVEAEEAAREIQHVTGEGLLVSLNHLNGEAFRHNLAMDVLRMEMDGEAVLDDDAIKVITENTTFTRLLKQVRVTINGNGEEQRHISEEALYLAERIAARKYDDNEQRMHEGALRILRAEMGEGSPLDWKRRVAANETVPEAVRLYAEHEQLPRLNFYIEYGDTLLPDVEASADKTKSLEERQKLQERFRTEASRTINALYGIEEGENVPDDIQRMIVGFKQGDLRQFGYDKGDYQVFNQEGVMAVFRYIDRVGYIGADNARKLHETFGTINFMSYTHETLQTMLRYESHPEEYPAVDVIVRGANGDHNGAFDQRLRSRRLNQTLIFEVDSPQEIESITTLIDKNNTEIRKVTLAGHGDRAGLHLSNNTLIGGVMPDGRRRGINASMVELMNRIVPDANGERPVVLDSCSQGRRYGMGSTQSLAETVSLLIPDSRVDAAPRVAYGHDVVRGSEGDVQIRTNRHYELAKFLEKYDKYPGVGFLARKLMSHKRRRAGTFVVRNGRRSRDKNGIINIGA